MSKNNKENIYYQNYQSRLYIEARFIVHLSTILPWFVWLWIKDTFLIFRNIKRDVRQCNLNSLSILYNALIKYPLLGFEPIQFFEYKLYKNSYKEYMTINDTLIKIGEKNKQDPFKPYLLDNKFSFKKHIYEKIRVPKLIAYFNHHNKKIEHYNNPSNNKVVIKNVLGEGGGGVRIVPADNFIDFFKKSRKSKIAEEFIEQHNFLNEIFNGSVNTIRCITAQNNDGIFLLNTTLKVGVKKTKGRDNVHFGGFCVGIDMESGELGIGRPFYHVGNVEYKRHPETKYKFYGKKLPYYDELKKIAIEAHKCFPMYTIIGWDIAISETGPVVIEGNRLPDLKLCEIHEPLKQKILSFIKEK